jgi:glycosyltransferase involved in cell wall biosynthesis
MAKLIWHGAAFDPSGYGEATRGYLLALDNLGVDLTLANVRFWKGPQAPIEKTAYAVIRKGIMNKPDRTGGTRLFHLTPENYAIDRNCKTHIGMTTFETDSVPLHWLIPMRAMDHIITYSSFNKRTFLEAGVKGPISVVPHGVDTDLFKPNGEGLAAIDNVAKDKFVFGSNFEWSERKNPKCLLTAFYRTFKNKDNVMLVIKTYHQHPLEKSRDTVKAAIANLKAELKVGNDAPPIMLIFDTLCGEDMARFYRSLDCYVFPTRGEGWNLSVSEAMSSALPTITTNWSAHLDFCDASNSMLVDCKVVPVANRELRERPHYQSHSWAEPSWESLGNHMLRAYSRRDEVLAMGEKARNDMIAKWTWRSAGKKLHSVLGQVGL